MIWTFDDYKAGLCDSAEVGSERPPEPPTFEIEELPPALQNVPEAILKRDALAAYKALGGPRYLAENPALLSKLLVKFLPVQVTSDQRTEVAITIRYSNPDFNKATIAEDADIVEALPAPIEDATPSPSKYGSRGAAVASAPKPAAAPDTSPNGVASAPLFPKSDSKRIT
jgi:hypothetical protein